MRPNPSGERASKHGGAPLRSRRKAWAERRHDKREGKQAGQKGKGRAELSRRNKQKLNTAVFVLCTSETSETALHTVSCGQGNGTIVQIKTCVYSNRFSSSGEKSFLREAEPQVIRASRPLPRFFPMWPFSQSKQPDFVGSSRGPTVSSLPRGVVGQNPT